MPLLETLTTEQLRKLQDALNQELYNRLNDPNESFDLGDKE